MGEPTKSIFLHAPALNQIRIRSTSGRKLVLPTVGKACFENENTPDVPTRRRLVRSGHRRDGTNGVPDRPKLLGTA